jgi:transcriptional regulator with XRE-family HTH domain
LKLLSAPKLPERLRSLTIALLVSHKATACFLPAGFRLNLWMDTPSPMIHHGRNVKRIREILGVKQDFLATSLGLSQQAVSQLEQKEVMDKAMLQKLSKVLGVPEEAIENFSDEAAVNIISSTLHHTNGIVNYFPTFNLADKWLETIEENKKLYERLLQAEREKNELLQKLLDAKQ